MVIAKDMEVAIIRYTGGTGRAYIVEITNNPDKWLVENNLYRKGSGNEPEKLSDFDIEWTRIKIYGKVKYN